MGEGPHDIIFTDRASSAAGGEPGCAVNVVKYLDTLTGNDKNDEKKLTCMLRGTRGRKVDS